MKQFYEERNLVCSSGRPRRHSQGIQQSHHELSTFETKIWATWNRFLNADLDGETIETPKSTLATKVPETILHGTKSSMLFSAPVQGYTVPNTSWENTRERLTFIEHERKHLLGALNTRGGHTRMWHIFHLIWSLLIVFLACTVIIRGVWRGANECPTTSRRGTVYASRSWGTHLQ